MYRFRLLILPFLVTLSSWEGGVPFTSDEPVETALAQGAASSPGSWTLPWYYLAAPVCLTGRTGPENLSLIDSLLKLSEYDPGQFERVLLGTTQEGDTTLIDRIRYIANASDTPHKWIATWADATNGHLDVQVRRLQPTADDSLPAEAMLLPNALVLPWPFPNDPPGTYDKSKLQEVAEDHLGITIPMAPALGSNGFYLDRLMSVADSLVVPLINDSDPLNAVKDRPAAVRNAIISRVRKYSPYPPSHYSFPSALRMRVLCPSADDCRPTTATQLRYVHTGPATPGPMYLDLGWDLNRTPKPIGARYDKWPCDAVAFM
jgi:hypothetical protein